MDALSRFFLVRESKSSLTTEILGGLSNFLVMIFTLEFHSRNLGGACTTCWEPGSNETSSNNFTSAQYRAFPTSTALSMGASSILAGLMSNTPLVLGPGMAAIELGRLASDLDSFPSANAATIIVGFLTLIFGLLYRQIKLIGRMPEDYRLGYSAGIGAMLALVALRQCGLVNMNGTYNKTFNYNVILSLLGFYIIALAQHKRYLRSTFILSISIVTALSLIIRSALGATIVPEGSPTITLFLYPDGEVSTPSIASAPNFDAFTGANSFLISQYVVKITIHTIINCVGSVTALVLTMVITRIGYDKQMFTEILSESTKCERIFLAVGLCNTLFAPFLGTGSIVVYIQSQVGAVVGARTGLCSVVAGVLFLLAALAPGPIGSIIPSSATGPSFFIACLPVISAIRFVDYTSPVRMFPSLLAMFLICFAYSYPMGVAYSFVLLFALYATTEEWRTLTPQMVGILAAMVLLLLLETHLVNDNRALGVCIGVFAALVAIATWLMGYRYAHYFDTRSTLVLVAAATGDEGVNNNAEDERMRSFSQNSKAPV